MQQHCLWSLYIHHMCFPSTSHPIKSCSLQFTDRIKQVQLELNPDLSDGAIEPVADEDQPIILHKIGEGSVGIDSWRFSTICTNTMTVSCWCPFPQFGKVYRGLWRGETVAVKCIVIPSSVNRNLQAEKMAVRQSEAVNPFVWPWTLWTSWPDYDLFNLTNLQVMEAAISISMQHQHLVRTYTYSLRPLAEDRENSETLWVQKYKSM